MPSRSLLFVYGTLKRGCCRSHFLAGQSCLGEARTQPKYRMYNCGTYPGLTPDAEGLSIHGELWSVDEACLARLDQEEGVDEGLYTRSSIELATPLPESFAGYPVDAYFYTQSVNEFPDCGDQWVD